MHYNKGYFEREETNELKNLTLWASLQIKNILIILYTVVAGWSEWTMYCKYLFVSSPKLLECLLLLRFELTRQHNLKPVNCLRAHL